MAQGSGGGTAVSPDDRLMGVVTVRKGVKVIVPMYQGSGGTKIISPTVESWGDGRPVGGGTADWAGRRGGIRLTIR
jgi:hypothetical protein